MLMMAKRLTDDPEWNLYWTDLAYDNFAVDPSGKLMVIDAENIMVVDKEAVKLGNSVCKGIFKTWNMILNQDSILKFNSN